MNITYTRNGDYLIPKSKADRRKSIEKTSPSVKVKKAERVFVKKSLYCN